MQHEIAAQPQLAGDGENAPQPVYLFGRAPCDHQVDGEGAAGRDERGHQPQERCRERAGGKTARLEEIHADEIVARAVLSGMGGNPLERVRFSNGEPFQFIQSKFGAGDGDHLRLALDAGNLSLRTPARQQPRHCAAAQSQNQRPPRASRRQQQSPVTATRTRLWLARLPITRFSRNADRLYYTPDFKRDAPVFTWHDPYWKTARLLPASLFRHILPLSCQDSRWPAAARCPAIGYAMPKRTATAGAGTTCLE